jgi:hypothetical protein
VVLTTVFIFLIFFGVWEPAERPKAIHLVQGRGWGILLVLEFLNRNNCARVTLIALTIYSSLS